METKPWPKDLDAATKIYFNINLISAEALVITPMGLHLSAAGYKDSRHSTHWIMVLAGSGFRNLESKFLSHTHRNARQKIA